MSGTVLLFSNLTAPAQDLLDSLRQADIPVTPVFLEDDGFLPAGALSPYTRVLQQEKEAPEGRPLYFDRLPVPKYWEIRGTGSGGEIVDYETVRGRICYCRQGKEAGGRFVHIVDWLDRDGKVRFSDHYDRHGRRFAQTVLSKEEKPVLRCYFTPSGREVITRNLVTGSLLVREKNTEKIYASAEDFTADFLESLAPDRIFYNSLAAPYFAATAYVDRHPEVREALFWQEKILDTIPGNMVQLLNKRGDRVRIFVQTGEAYAKLREKTMDRAHFGKDLRDPEQAQKALEPLGYVYPYRRVGNLGFRDILVMTNSDQIFGLGEIADSLPQFTFHVAAVTEMSEKLQAMGTHPNIRLYPGISAAKAQCLFLTCGCLLDICEGGEILDAVRESFLSSMLIFGYLDTAHNRQLVPETALFPKTGEGRKALCSALRQAAEDPVRRNAVLDAQNRHAMAEDAARYRELLGTW
ncbi:MAG: accessory Sec system glycosylation chaperone GtfB [Lachnospiraceae bacterium]